MGVSAEMRLSMSGISLVSIVKMTFTSFQLHN